MYIFFGEIPNQALCSFFQIRLSFCCWVVRAFYMLWILIFVTCFKYLLPLYCLPFNSHNGLFWWTEVFNSNEVQHHFSFAFMPSHVWLFATLWTIACQAPLSMEFYRQEYWSGLPCLHPGDLPDPGTEPASPVAPALQSDSLSLRNLESPTFTVQLHFSCPVLNIFPI